MYVVLEEKSAHLLTSGIWSLAFGFSTNCSAGNTTAGCRISSKSLPPGITLQHHPHQLLRCPVTSRHSILSFPGTRACPGMLLPDADWWCSSSARARSSSHSGTPAPTFTMRSSLRFMTPPIPSISWRAYPGPSCGLGVRSSARAGGLTLLAALQGDVAAKGLLLLPMVVVVALLRLSASRAASAASQSVSSSRSRPAQQRAARPQGTPRSPSPMPVPRPPRTEVYWWRHFQMLERGG